MTKVINKKALLVLLTLVLAFCWLAVPVYAAEIEDDTSYSAGNGELIFVSPNEGMAERSVTSNMLNKLVVYAAKKQADGTYTTYTFGDYPLIENGPANILNCYLPDGYYQAMWNEGLDYFYCELTFTVKGTNLSRVKIEVDDDIVITGKVASSGGTYTAKWYSPRRETTTFSVVVYDINNVNAMSWGHIYK